MSIETFATPAEYFKHAMEVGLELRRQGKHLEATEEFKRALRFAPTNWNRSEAAQARGIDFRLAGWFDDSMLSFTKALQLSQDVPHRLATIMRDFAMLRLDEGNIAEAQLLLSQAMQQHALAKLRRTIRQDAFAKEDVELAITRGFFARTYPESQRELALECFEEAYQDIRGHDDIAELNHLVWWMKRLRPIGRLRRLPRAVWLAATTRHTGRLIEVGIIALTGPRLVDMIKRRKQGR